MLKLQPPNVTIFGGRTFIEAIEVKVGLSSDRISVHIRRHTRELFGFPFSTHTTHPQRKPCEVTVIM